MSTTWLDWMRKRVSGKERGLPWWVSNKLSLTKFCESNDLPVPRIYEVWDHPDRIRLDAAPNEFVLKPNHMYSAIGVMVLSRREGGKFYDSLSGKLMTENEIRSVQESVFAKSKNPGSMRFFIEEKILDENVKSTVPLDYKIYTFYGRPLMVSQIDRNIDPKRYAWFDGQFDPLDVGDNIRTDWRHISPGQPKRPDCWSDMLDVAFKASKLLRTPFVSVDMYASVRGPILGELTLTPGGPYYGEMWRLSETMDKKLGEAWADAAFRIRDEEWKDSV